jgi:hypothetical protein
LIFNLGYFSPEKYHLESLNGIGTTLAIIRLKVKVESNFTCEQITDIRGIGIGK